MASAQSSPYTANHLKSRCRPTAKTTISTSASPIERHRMERIGGDRICEIALTAASSMAVQPLVKALARGRYIRALRQEGGTRTPGVERFVADRITGTRSWLLRSKTVNAVFARL